VALLRSSEERKVSVGRLTVLQVAVVCGFLLLAGAFWFFQIIQHEQFNEMAENNHQRELALRAPRGVLFDRNGRVLVENRPSFNVSIVRLKTTDLDRTIHLLSAVAGVEESSIREIVDRHRREPSYRPIVVIENATLAQVAAITARRLDFELPDVVVQQVPTRQYPADELGAHLFGYVGEATDSQVEGDQAIKVGDIVGQAGFEKAHNALLMGKDGARTVIVNSVGREMGELERVEPVEGQRLQLTIDYDLERAAEDGFNTLGYNGAAVVLDPGTGEVLAFTSRPAYDPNAFANGIGRGAWQALNTDEQHPLTNRAIQGRYSPGSTFKMAVALAALEEGIITPDFKVHCSGGGTFYGRYFKCWRKGGHGTVDLRHAIEQSCDVYFYTVGNMLGVDRIHKWATLLGLGVPSGIDLPNELTGLVPSTEWKRRVRGEKWYAGETISVAIGQGQVSVTPVSMAVYMATLANGGVRVTPHLVKAVDSGDGWKPVPAPAPQSTVQIDPGALQAIRDGLWMVVNAGGTARVAQIAGRDVSGKTGTAQVISNKGRAAAGMQRKDLRDNGWFVFFAPRDHPQIAGVVFAEHAEHGTMAAVIAHHILETFFAKQDGKPLPAFRAPGAPAPAPAPPVEPPARPAETRPVARTAGTPAPTGGR
jgi:penicillin-binding protein 2